MSLFQDEDVLTKEIEPWKGFADGFSSDEDRKVFMKMLNNCYKYAKAYFKHSSKGLCVCTPAFDS
ncbi:MAG: hypothetical protein WCC17_19375 [Candidatus Nitrosopolaris sp.]